MNSTWFEPVGVLDYIRLLDKNDSREKRMVSDGRFAEPLHPDHRRRQIQ